MTIRFAFRLVRVLLHLVQGLLTCALVFPWAKAERRNTLVRRWSRQLLAMCGVRVQELAGVAPLSHALIVANHVSWLDIFVINSLHPSRFVAKVEIREWPVVGWLVAMAGTVFIARGNRRDLRHIFQGLVDNLKTGERVAFFPEGTTAQQGTVLPFHANLFEAAIDARIDVQPYALRYVDRHGAFHPAVDYVGETNFVQSMLAILRSQGVRAQLVCLEPIPAAGAHRRELAVAAHDAIAAALKAS
ncbi:1-acyl-sn-glycerol-3-phosphate acyltransferase [Massilia arenosa]|uniref:1-acyl-sn-glycerol-3-phosphate acyltransferase n=1 Tax=Zemynaea arenosa TaxID=2561931 RepID=A0A4Y9SF02_9BURK|nr:lysophospholipid acyltransferase family protein [Massilia arenosa]TFW19705.1 1-acyl-sn-glycerol-3-phosphate acyltransferase [Massilia arenosa]